MGAARLVRGGETGGVGRLVPVARCSGWVVLVKNDGAGDGDDGFDSGAVEAATEVVVFLSISCVFLVEAVDGEVVGE